MKTYNFFYLLIFLIFYNECRFGSRNGKNTIGKSNRGRMPQSQRRMSHAQKGGRASGINSGKNRGNNYSHGAGRHNYNQYNAYGNFGSFGGSAAWGLSGLGMGLILGSTIGSSKSSSNDNITIINSYDNKNETHNNYDNINKNLKIEIEKIKNLSNTIHDAKKEIKENYLPPFIKTYFSPYQKTEIIQKTSQELYGDLNKEIVEIVNFKGNQEIKNQIDSIRNNIQPNLKKLISMTHNENKDELEKIQNDLRIALKILNQTIVDTVKKINQ